MRVKKSVCRKEQGVAEPGNTCLTTPGTCESCPNWWKHRPTKGQIVRAVGDLRGASGGLRANKNAFLLVRGKCLGNHVMVTLLAPTLDFVTGEHDVKPLTKKQKGEM